MRQLRCDQGTNFVGAQNELKAALEELDQVQLQEYLVENGCEWILLQMNVPYSSHMGVLYGQFVVHWKMYLSVLAPNWTTRRSEPS